MEPGESKQLALNPELAAYNHSKNYQSHESADKVDHQREPGLLRNRPGLPHHSRLRRGECDEYTDRVERQERLGFALKCHKKADSKSCEHEDSIVERQPVTQR